MKEPRTIKADIILTPELYTRYGRYDTGTRRDCNRSPIARAIYYWLRQHTTIAFTMVLDDDDSIDVIHRSFLRTKYRAKIPEGLRGSVDKKFKLVFRMTKEERELYGAPSGGW